MLEVVLAALRGRAARPHLPASVEIGRILDIGCGAGGWFLETVRAAEREGLDRVCSAEARTDAPAEGGRCRLQRWDAAQGTLPFSSDWFDAVVMLAFVEHLTRRQVESLFLDTYRVLKPGGRCVLTTPAPGAERLLRWLARWGLVSHEEIEEHHDHFSLPELRELLCRAGFDERAICQGRFECGMNLWMTAEKGR